MSGRSVTRRVSVNCCGIIICLSERGDSVPLIKFNVRNQSLRQYNSVVVVADSHSYLKLQFNFLTEDWASVGTKTVWLIGASRSYPVILDDNNQCYVKDTVIVPPGFGVTVSGGGITTNAVEVPVVSNGCGPCRPPMFDTELYYQLLDKIDNVEAVKADNIIHNEEEGYIQLSANGVPIGEQVELTVSDCGIKNVDVDENENITITLTDGRVIDIGQVSGASGATFTPHIDEHGILTWTCDKDLPVPEPTDLNCRDEWREDSDDFVSDDYIWEDE